MFKFLKPKKPTEHQSEESQTPQSWLQRFNQGLSRTRKSLTEGLSSIFLGRKQIDAELFEELETLLLTADVGYETTTEILTELTQQVARQQLTDPAILLQSLKSQLVQRLRPYCQPLEINHKPFIILMVGINGSGKTTSAAKLAHYFKESGKKVMLAAGDTFRAAAIEQLQAWGERNTVPVINQEIGADSASVIFDAVQAATARQYEILLADTAGRLHTQKHLMQELQKIERVMKKLDASAPHEIFLVLDATQGQNALTQAEQFRDAVGVSGIILTKLDGTAKGGILFSIAHKMKLPIRFIGVGEQLTDLRPFDAEEFVHALLGDLT